MLRPALYLFLAIMLAAPVRAQWEQLPLWGGHADLLVQNKYKKNEIFAVIARGGLYRSEDYGSTWNTVVASFYTLGNGERDWANLTVDYDYAADFEVSGTDTYYIYVRQALWRSDDRGVTWTHDSSFGVGFGRSAILESNEDGTLFFSPWWTREKHIFSTIGDGKTWNSVPYTCVGCYRNLYSVPGESSHVILYGSWEYLRTTNSGTDWLKLQLPSNDLWHGMTDASIDSGLALAVWNRRSNLDCNEGVFSVLTSADTGSTWHTVRDSVLVLPVRGYDEMRHRAIRPSPAIMMMQIYNTLFRSTDGGMSVREVDSIHVWDVLALDSTVLAACTNQGFMESTDSGATWHQIAKPWQLPGYNQIEFRVAGNGVMYAVISDGDDYGYALSKLMQSVDAGMTWTEILRARSLHSLRVSASPQPRYYVVADDHAILTGTLGQSVPDTVFTHAKTISDLETTDAFPGDLYAVLRGGWEYRYSTDYGRTWTAHGVPGYLYSGFWLVPSRTIQGVAVAVTLPMTVDMIEGMGLWKVVVSSDDWYYTCKRNDLGQPLIFMLDGDVIFNAHDHTFSTNYGWTWKENVAGIDPADLAALYPWGSRYFAPHGRLIVADSSRWYHFDGDRWNRLRDIGGRPLSGPPLSALDLVGTSLYVACPYSGLFRIRLDPETAIQEPAGPVSAATLVCYPNPARHGAQIEFRLSDDGPESGTAWRADRIQAVG
jgi:photosystem II stability/assembly factor-like uncharacterized protein